MDKVVCKNCGHESHCGVPFRKNISDSTNASWTNVEVCKKCRCLKCETKMDFG